MNSLKHIIFHITIKWKKEISKLESIFPYCTELNKINKFVPPQRLKPKNYSNFGKKKHSKIKNSTRNFVKF